MGLWIRRPPRTARKHLEQTICSLPVFFYSLSIFQSTLTCVLEVFNKLHGSHQVTGLEQGLKLGVELMMEGDGAFEQRFPALSGKIGHKGHLSSRQLIPVALRL